MKKVFFVNPCDDFLEKRGDRPPLGILQLSAWVKLKGHSSKVYDLNHDSFFKLSLDALNEEPDFICIAVSTPNYKQCINLARILRKIAPVSAFVAGGTHVTDFPTEGETNQNFDYIIVGDGELSIQTIIDGEAKIKILNNRLEKLDELPIPDYDAIDMARYTMTVDRKRGALIATQRGCPFKCSFCGSANKPFTQAEPIHKTIVHMGVLYEKYHVRGFYFVDDTFTYYKKNTIALCEEIKKNFPDIVFRCTTRANCLNDDVCKALKDAGCTIVSIGLESGDEKVLKAINKLETLEQQKEGVRLCKKYGLKTKGFFIFGLPDATYERELKTIEMAKELRVDYADAYVFTPYPGTPIWENPEKFSMNIRKPTDGNWNNYFQVGKDGLPPVLQFEHPNLTEQQIRELVQKFKDEVHAEGLTY